MSNQPAQVQAASKLTYIGQIKYDALYEKPQFNDFLKEDLRSRLLLVKQALMRTVSDEDFAKLSVAFSEKVLKTFKHMAPLCSSIPSHRLKDEIVKQLLEPQAEEHVGTVKKYAGRFISEFYHFLLLYGFIDS